MIQDPSFLIGIYLFGFALILSKGCFNRSKRINKLALVFWLIGVWPIVTNLMVPRQLDYVLFGGAGWHMDYVWSAALIWAGRLTTLSLVICLFTCIYKCRDQGFPSPGYPLFVSYLLFSSSVIIASVFGIPGGGFSQSLLMPFVLFTVMYLVVNQSFENVIIYAKRVCLVYIYLSLLVAVLNPGWAVLTGAHSVIPGITSRLFGVASNANGLGPIALLYIFLDIKSYKRTYFDKICYLAALIVLVWAQSKTIWIAAIIGYFLKLWFGKSENGKISTYRGTLRFLYIFIPVLAVVFVLLLPVSENQKLGEDPFGTLTGRTILWKITIDEWEKTPIFGYGPNLWDEKFRSRHIGFRSDFASHAHNMFVQQLGETGIVGVVFLCVFVVVLIRIAWLVRDQFNGLSLALISIPLVRCFTESALNNRSMGESTFVNFTIFGVLIFLMKKKQSSIGKIS
jgi:O-antigen ligase